MTRPADVGARAEAVWVSADRAAVGVGLVTLGMGVALVVAPARAAQVLGLEGPAVLVRSLGVADLLLAPALLRPRRRGRAMVCRAVLNAVIAATYLAQLRRPGDRRRAAVGAIGMTALTVVDGSLAMVLLKRTSNDAT